MSKDDNKPKRGRKSHIRVVKSGESVMAKPSVEQIKQIYMASKHLEWIPFALSMNWDPTTTRDQYPTVAWISEKKTKLAQHQAEEIAELVFDHRSRWHRDVLKTLRDYPEASDAMLGILKARENDIIAMINHDMEEKRVAAQEGRDPVLKFAKVRTSELLALSMALKNVTETKHKSLLINDWSVKVAEQFTDPTQFDRSETKMKDTGWKLEVIGGENITAAQMQEFLGKWYDKPQRQVEHTPDQLEPEEDS